jgi:hypothetical protein
MVDPDEDPEAFRHALEREAWRISAVGQPSGAGELVLASVAATISAGLSHMSAEVQTEVAKRALLVLARSEFEAAANALAVVLLDGMTRLVTADALANDNVLTMRGRQP